MGKLRLDAELVRRALFGTREQAKRAVMAGEIFVEGRRVGKPSMQVAEEARIEVRARGEAFVSRGGQKLEKALAVFDIDVSGGVAADIGASTGGFTDCLMRRGALKVYAIDVGYGQLDYRLRTHPAVVVMERTNARYLTPGAFDEPLDIAVMDVSFISAALILPALYPCMRENGQAVILIKPQFEAGRELVGKHGVVRDKKVHAAVLNTAMQKARDCGFFVRGLDYSPVKGPEGNIEFLLHLAKAEPAMPVDAEAVVEAAHAALQP